MFITISIKFFSLAQDTRFSAFKCNYLCNFRGCILFLDLESTLQKTEILILRNFTLHARFFSSPLNLKFSLWNLILRKFLFFSTEKIKKYQEGFVTPSDQKKETWGHVSYPSKWFWLPYRGYFSANIMLNWWRMFAIHL